MPNTLCMHSPGWWVLVEELHWRYANRKLQAHLTNVEESEQDSDLHCAVFTFFYHPHTRQREICITKGLSWPTLVGVIERAPACVTLLTYNQPWLCSSALGGCGKSLGVGGKMPPISPCGLKWHVDYSVRNNQRSLCEQLSVAWWMPPAAGWDKASHRQKEFLCVTLCWRWHHVFEELLWNWKTFAPWLSNQDFSANLACLWAFSVMAVMKWAHSVLMVKVVE